MSILEILVKLHGFSLVILCFISNFNFRIPVGLYFISDILYFVTPAFDHSTASGLSISKA